MNNPPRRATGLIYRIKVSSYQSLPYHFMKIIRGNIPVRNRIPKKMKTFFFTALIEAGTEKDAETPAHPFRKNHDQNRT